MSEFNFKFVTTNDQELEKIQQNIGECFDFLADKEIVGGQFINSLSNGSPITLGTTAVLVPHKLGRPVRGYFVVSATLPAVVYDQESTNTVSQFFVKLLATATTTVSLWVF